LLTCCQQFFPPVLKAELKVVNDDRAGPNNSLVPPPEIAESGVGVFRKCLFVPPRWRFRWNNADTIVTREEPQ